MKSSSVSINKQNIVYDKVISQPTVKQEKNNGKKGPKRFPIKSNYYPTNLSLSNLTNLPQL